MKRILVILTIGLSFVPLATAQAKLRPGFSFGLKGGLNVSEFSGTAVDEAWQTKVGFAAGGFLAYRFGDGLALQPEILFSQKGVHLLPTSIAGGSDLIILKKKAEKMLAESNFNPFGRNLISFEQTPQSFDSTFTEIPLISPGATILKQ